MCFQQEKGLQLYKSNDNKSKSNSQLLRFFRGLEEKMFASLLSDLLGTTNEMCYLLDTLLNKLKHMQGTATLLYVEKLVCL